MGKTATLANIGSVADGSLGFRNRIINGAMVIDQRNAGASISLISGGGIGYPADRWYVENNTDGTATTQQVSDAPTGFSNSIKYTVTATDSSLASDQSAFMQQRVEGFNFADLAFGTASALTVTVSFWVKSSVTGTFGVALANSAYNRGYPASFTVNTANTWEQKTATIAGDTTGTWIGATNGIGVRVSFAVAAGSARVATSGAWSASVVLGVSSQVNLMATNGATFQVTGVQLEKGATATSFDYRPYGTELALCQRYLPMFTFGASEKLIAGQAISTTQVITTFLFPVTARSVATGVTSSAGSNFALGDAALGYGANQTGTAIAFETGGVNQASVKLTCTSGLVAGNASIVLSRFANTTIQFTGCEL
jgi:hypothetical protein